MKNVTTKDSNVVDLMKYRKPMKHPILVDMLDYWEGLRNGRIAPMRSEIDPRAIENGLEHSFILERVQKNQVRFRIAGMGLADLMGMEVRGMPVPALFAPESRDAVVILLDRIFETPEIVELHLQAARPGGETQTAQMLLLPLQDDQGEVTRILGCLVAEVQTGEPPHRFILAGKTVTRIVTKGAHPRRQMQSGFAESPDIFTPRPAVAPTPAPAPAPADEINGSGYLRLVKTEE